MNLINKINRNYLYSALVALPVVSVGLFFSIRYFVVEEIDEKLIADYQRAVEEIVKSDKLPNLYPVIEINLLQLGKESKPEFNNVYVYDPVSKEEELFRQLTSQQKINRKLYQIKVRSSMLETHDFLYAIIFVMLLLMIFLLLISFWLNNRLSKRMWQTLNNNLQQIELYSVVNKSEIHLIDSNVNEFNKLNKSVSLLINHIQRDYEALKEFTENASHELQTPLAIIIANCEQLLQNIQAEAEVKSVYIIYQSAKKLSVLNEKLLLLTKIENNQFTNYQKVNLVPLFRQQLKLINELNQDVNVELLTNDKDFIVDMDKDLAEILVSNIVGNSFKHNFQNGQIKLYLDDNKLYITNTTNEEVDVKNVFNRFVHSGNKNSLGIGLEIVKRICVASNIKVDVTKKSEIFSLVLSKIQK